MHLMLLYIVLPPCCQVPDLATMFQNLDFSDVWVEGRMSEVCRYLRGNKHLAIPDGWRALLPTVLPF